MSESPASTIPRVEHLWSFPHAVPYNKYNGHTEVNIVTSVQQNVNVRKHGIILNLTLAHSWAVIGNEDKLGLSVSDRLDGLLVAHHNLARTHH